MDFRPQALPPTIVLYAQVQVLNDRVERLQLDIERLTKRGASRAHVLALQRDQKQLKEALDKLSSTIEALREAEQREHLLDQKGEGMRARRLEYAKVVFSFIGGVIVVLIPLLWSSCGGP